MKTIMSQDECTVIIAQEGQVFYIGINDRTQDDGGSFYHVKTELHTKSIILGYYGTKDEAISELDRLAKVITQTSIPTQYTFKFR